MGKRKIVEFDSDSVESGDEMSRDECFIAMKLIEYVEKRPYLWLTSHKKYRDTAMRKAAYGEFEKKYQLKEGSAMSSWRRLANQFRAFEKKKKERSVSGSGADDPDDDFFPYYEEMIFLKKEEEISEGHRTSSSGATEDEIVIDESASSIIIDTPSSSTTPVPKKDLSSTSRNQIGGLFKFDGKSVTVDTKQPRKKKGNKESELDKLLAAQDEAIKQVIEKMGSENAEGEYGDLKAKLTNTLNSIPASNRSLATDEIFLFLSSIERKYSNPVGIHGQFPPPPQFHHAPPPNHYYYPPQPPHQFHPQYNNQNLAPHSSQPHTSLTSVPKATDTSTPSPAPPPFNYDPYAIHFPQ